MLSEPSKWEYEINFLKQGWNYTKNSYSKLEQSAHKQSVDNAKIPIIFRFYKQSFLQRKIHVAVDLDINLC